MPSELPKNFWSILTWNVRASVSCSGSAERRFLCVSLSDNEEEDHDDATDDWDAFWTCSEILPEGSYASGVFPLEHLDDKLVFRARLIRTSTRAILHQKTFLLNKSSAYDPDLHCFGPLPAYSGCAFHAV